MKRSTHYFWGAVLIACLAAGCGGSQAQDTAPESARGEGEEVTPAEAARTEADDRAELIETLQAQGEVFVKMASGCVRFEVANEVPNLVEASDAPDAPSFYIYRSLFGEYNLEYWSAKFSGSTMELTGPTRALVTASGPQRVDEGEGVTQYPLPTLFADHVAFSPEGSSASDAFDPTTLRVFWFEERTCAADDESAVVPQL